MPPAARVGDMTSHGTPLSPGPGSSNVFIGGNATWRAKADFHSCPLVDPGQKPHVGGKVSLSSKTVLINNLPAARMGDVINEGIPNTIISGCLSVIIG